jgi:hypothetical protein
LGEIPVAGIVWSNQEITSQGGYDVRAATSQDAVAPGFTGGMVFQAAKAGDKCKAASLTLSSDGDKVFVDRKYIGEIRN